MSDSTPDRSKEISLLVLSGWFTGLFVLVIMRSITAIHHLPPDPALSFQWTARTDSVIAAFSLEDGYLQLIPRLLSELLDTVPLSQLTYWSTSINAIVVAFTGVIVGLSIQTIAGWPRAALASVGSVIPFSAHEGLVGNVWAIRWTLITAGCVVVCSPSFRMRYRRISTVVFVVAGLSHAYIFIPLTVLLVSVALTRRIRERDRSDLIVLAFLTGLQFMGFLLGDTPLQKYESATVYWPWYGSGVFWWSVFLSPIALSVLALLLCLADGGVKLQTHANVYLFAFSSLLFALTVYLQLGVKSSPVVATASLGFISVLVATSRTGLVSTTGNVSRLLSAGAVSLYLILCVRYLPASSYLTSGEFWRHEVARAKVECREGSATNIDLVYLVGGDFESAETMNCETLTDWDSWSWTRKR